MNATSTADLACAAVERARHAKQNANNAYDALWDAECRMLPAAIAINRQYEHIVDGRRYVASSEAEMRKQGASVQDLAKYRAQIAARTKQRRESGVESFEIAHEEAEGRFKAAMMAVINIPATTPAGIAAKLSFTREAIEDGATVYDADILASVIADLRALTA